MWPFLAGLLLGILVGVLLMAALVSSRRSPDVPTRDPERHKEPLQ